MSILKTFLNIHFNINNISKNYSQSITLKPNDILFSINDFSSTLNYSNLKDDFYVAEFYDFFKMQKNSLAEFNSVTKKITDIISFHLKEKGIIFSFDFQYKDKGIFIFSMPKSFVFKNKDKFKRDFFIRLTQLYLAHNNKKFLLNNKHISSNHLIKEENFTNNLKKTQILLLDFLISELKH